MGRIFNFKIYIKKYISTFISILLIYFQAIFSFAITSSIISAISIKQSYAYNEIIPPQNIKDNPIDHITPDNSVNIPGTNNNTHLDRTQNGTPMVNINNANNQGISANYYKDFNVDNQNLILNNHKGEAVNTQLGGVVYGNPNFNNTNGREADIILNEITTNRISNINGYIEVAGKRADVIIANPNGIMVGGAGFINTNRLSMITGSSLNQNIINGTKSSFDQNGNLNPFLLTDTNKNPNAIIQVVGRNITDNQGNIVAYNLGIDAQDVRYADLISRVVKINGNIHGNIIQTEDKPFATEVNIKTGNDRAYYNTDENGNKNNKGFNVKSTVNYQPSTINCEAEAASHKPEFAIDSTAFGGIYAGRINFIATEEGVGVRTRSDLIASTDDLNFDVNGNIILEEEGSLYAKRDVNLNNKTKAKNKNNNNTNPSNKTTAENKNNTIINKSTIAAENNININTDELINSNSNIISNSNSDSTSSLSSNSKIYALNDINITNAELIDNSNNGLINAGNNINIVNNNILNNENGLIVLSSRSNYSNTNTNTNTSSTSNTSSTTTSPKITIDTRTSLNNTNGSIVSNGSAGDIDINVLTDYIINGTLYSNNNININAKNIKNYSDVISANNITFTANNGNIYNGTEGTNATIIAMNDIIFNILKDGNNTGSLYNYGKISANNNIEINAEDSVYNGLTTGSNATITANNNLTITTNNRIINKGYIQAVGLTDRNTGKKIEGTGNLILTTNTEINDDYDLGNSTSSLDNLLNKANEISSNNETISPEIQAKLDNIDNITDYNELDNLLKEVKTEEQYYLVQSRIRILKIKDTLKEIEEDYLFNPEDWTLGNEVIVDYEYNEEIGEETEVKDTLTEELLQTRLQALLQDNYDYEDWDITAKLAEAEQNIDNEIQAQNERYVQYNQTQKQLAKENYNAQKEQAREQYIQDNGNDGGFNYEPFEWTDYTLEQYVNNNQDIETNGIIDNAKKQTILQETESNLKSQRFNEIKSIITSQQEKAANGLNNIDWNKLTNEQLQEQLSDILGNNYDSIKWSINDYNDANPLTAITNEYLAALRIDNIDTNKTEQTGIHNYGRLYSNNNSEFNSNSVLHNNKGSLIYSNNDINFNINKVLFNNENNLGQGIFANNNINIRGYKSNSTSKIFNNDGAKNTNWGTGTNKNTSTGNYYSAEKLINYDGLIEANNNIEILADDIINYGSDSIDLTKIDNTIKEKNKYYAYLPRKRGFGRGYTYSWREVSESDYNYYANGGTYTYRNKTITPKTRKDFQYYYVDESPELKSAYTTYYHHIRNAGLYETIMKGYDVAVSNQTSNSSTIKSNNSNINIRANNTTNYNSLIFANNNLNIETDNLLNKHSQINVNTLQYWQYKGKKCKHGRWGCKTYYNDWTSRVVLQLEGTRPSQILAKGNLNITANAIGNGTIQSNSDYSNNSNRIPYTQQTAPETNINIDNILNSGTINPLDFITTNNNNLSLPQGNYGIFRQPSNPNSNYLFETDPTLIDTNLFLGSTYFMNRLGLDPDTIDLKFLGDNYFEYELIRKAIEQQSLLTNTHLDPQQVKDKIDSLYNSMTQEKAQQLNLTIGEPLTEQQRNQLTEDTIWYVKQEITLPNGETYTALVPQIFYCNETLARLENERILNETGSILAGTNVILQAKSDTTDDTDNTIFNTILSNRGIITAKNTLAITDFDTINNITSSIRNDDINSLSQDKFNNQATLSAGNTLIITTTENGTVNNLSGLIALNGNTNSTTDNTTNNNSNASSSIYDNLLYINTGTLNNLTLSQQEEIEHKSNKKGNKYEFNKTSTYIGDIATIGSNNTNSNIIINANEDINILGGNILAEQDNSNITLQAGNNINIATVQDYEYQRQYMKRNGGTFGDTLTKENIDQSVTNIQSNISAGNNLSITTGNDLNSIGTNFTANNGDINLNIKNDLNLYNAMDYVYDYDYTKRESFDLASAIVNVASAVAVGALTGGAGAAVMAGISATSNAAGMTKGSIDIETNYDETIVANNITGNNININTNNSLNSISTKMNTENTINYNIGGNSFISEAQERHEYKITHEEFGGNIGRAVLGGAITGAMSGLGLNGGKYLGNLASSFVTDGILNASINGAVLTSVNAYSLSIGSVMSQTILNGGSFKDVLKAGRDSSISRNILMNTMIGAVIGATGGALGKVIKDVKAKYNSSLTQEQIQNKMTEIPVGESNLKIGNLNNNKVGINSYIKDGKIIQTGTPNINVNYFTSNQNIFFKAFNFLPGSPSFADFHDALNISGIWNQLSIPHAYMISQFNALYPYYPSLIYFNNTKENK